MATNGGRRRAGRRSFIKRLSPKPASLALLDIEDEVVPEPEPKPCAVDQPRRQQHFFQLVQRLQLEPSSRGIGFDRYFHCEYMGNAYFEGGVIARSLRKLRMTSRELVVRERVMTRDSVTRSVYFVGPADGLDDKIADFKTWLTPGCYQRTMEPTHFHEYFVGRDSIFGEPLSDFYQTVAWWSLDDGLFWTLRSDVAARIVQAVASRTVS